MTDRNASQSGSEQAAGRSADRRGFLTTSLRIAGAAGLFSMVGAASFTSTRGDEDGESADDGDDQLIRTADTDIMVWQLDPDRCIQCGKCETECVLDVSAVKVVNCFERCAMCDVCTGYFTMDEFRLNTSVENQLCPTSAVIRRFEREMDNELFFEYTIDEELCIGCGKCVEGCAAMNGSLYLQVRHDRCVNCNECAIAVACPSDAFRRVPRTNATIRKKEAQAAVDKLEAEKKSKASAQSPTSPSTPPD